MARPVPSETNVNTAGVDISLVLPVKNGWPFLAEQLSALAGQDSAEPFEVVVADNGSTDGSQEIARSFADRMELRLIDASARPGSAYARNAGVAASRGSRIVFADADDVVDRGYVSVMSTALRLDSVVAARIDWHLLNDHVDPSLLPNDQTVGVSGGMFGWLPFTFGGAMGVRRDAFEEVGGFDETIARADDVEFCWRLGLSDMLPRFVPAAVVHYRLREGMAASFKQGFADGQECPWLYRRYRQHGMPRHSFRSAARFWLGPVRLCARCRSKASFVACGSILGVRAGIIRGCVRSRVLYF